MSMKQFKVQVKVKLNTDKGAKIIEGCLGINITRKTTINRY
jgi:hypothetical protein